LRIGLRSSVIISHALTLDGLLAAAIFQRTQNVEAAHSTIPLSKAHGVWCGSAALIEGPAPARAVSIIQALRAELDLSPSIVSPGSKGYSRIEQARGPYRNKMSSYTALDTPALWFSGHGDVAAIRDLLRDIPAVGAKRGVGYGEVSEVSIDEAECAQAGHMLSDGSPARPIPVEAWRSIGGQDAMTSLEAWEPPYWRGERGICAIPAHRVVDRRSITRLIGL